ncbi:hypothetical protein BDN72DRAFT_844587 [Pluteus cervinus]|uniref:Uncharacterized protein n=1 Tax=Pluteus cervinus TaxID=181527 RepID=A0ACD3ALX6_9AGAR|nr:hypothetical protein BDN72DRAFT_844587 [Pluteus cervinus]
MSFSSSPFRIPRDDIAQERERIDEEIQQLQDRIYLLRTARNNLTPISRIPPEILIRIFTHVQGAWVGRRDFPSHFMRWIGVAHVWTQWRGVALGCASLWTTIPLRNEAYVRAALERSKSMPLSIGDVSRDHLGLTLEFLRDLSRVKYLRISPVEASSWGDAQGLILTQPAPILESFSTEMGCGFPRNLPDSLFNGSAPELRRLSLVNCSFNYRDLAFPKLTALHIETPHHRIRPHDLVNVLREMHHLEEVMLTNAFQGMDSQPLRGIPTYRIPRLRYLHIEDDRFGASEVFFSYISLPIGARVHFGSFGSSETGEHSFPISLQSIIQASHLHQSGIRKMSFDCRDSFRFKLWSSKSKMDEPLISIHFRGQLDYSKRSEEWFRACQHLPLQFVESLSVKGIIDQQTWQGVLSDCTQLSHLMIQGNSGRHFLRYLIQDFLTYRPPVYMSSDKGAKIMRTVVLASLKSLELRSVSLAGLSLEDLRSTFVARQRWGACLQLLVMRPLSEFSAILVEKLRGSRIRVRLEDDSHRKFTHRASIVPVP